jgi:hypothetical protein
MAAAARRPRRDRLRLRVVHEVAVANGLAGRGQLEDGVEVDAEAARVEPGLALPRIRNNASYPG